MLDNILWKPLMDLLYPYPEYQVPPNVPGYNPWKRRREEKMLAQKEVLAREREDERKRRKEEKEAIALAKQMERQRRQEERDASRRSRSARKGEDSCG